MKSDSPTPASSRFTVRKAAYVLGGALLLAGPLYLWFGKTDVEPTIEPPPAVKPGEPPYEPPVYRDLEKVSGAFGGEVIYSVPGTPAQVTEMILDFEAEPKHREYRQKCVVLSRQGNVHRITATYGEGLLSLDRILRHTVSQEGKTTRIVFEVEDRGAGLVRFDGVYLIEPAAEVPGRSRLTMQLHIDSGVFFRKVPQKEIQDGLLKDAGKVRKWMTLRLAGKS